MKSPLFTLFTLAILSSPLRFAMAGPNNNGAMVVHTDDSIDYTTGVNFCNQQLPTTCEALHTRTDKHGPTAAVIFAVAAFSPGANPCVTTVQFGIHHNLPPNQGHIYAFSMCGTLELPDSGWPEQGDPGIGDLVATHPTTALIWPFYWFACDENGPGTFFCTRTYPTTNEAKFVDCSDPPVEDLCTNFGCVHWFDDGGFNSCPRLGGACCFADGHCTFLTRAQCAQQGGTYQGDATSCTPNPCPQPPTGACCLGGRHVRGQVPCQIETQVQCQQDGGQYQGNGTSCTPNPCAQLTGACCFPDQTCQVLTEPACQSQGGSYQGDHTACSPNPCHAATGACCLPGHPPGQLPCVVETQAQCQQAGGQYQGDGTSCTPNPCAQPPTGACCLAGHPKGQAPCVVETQAQCQQAGGQYQGDGTTCTPNPCAQLTGACCFADGSCQVLTEPACQQQGGTYQGDHASCTPNPCPLSPPPDGNDLCSGALVLERCTAGSLTGNTSPDHNDYDPGSGGCANGYPEAGNDVTYVVQLNAGDVVDMTYTQLNLDGAFYIVTDCSNVPGTCVAGADATVTGQPETIHWNVANTGTYYIILDSYTTGGGPWTWDYTFPCSAPQACCFPDGHCQMLPPGDCSAQGGVPQGSGTMCNPNPCQVVPMKATTWGRIKGLYR